MADFGAIFRATDGTLLVSADTPTYELVQQLNPSSRSGNVSIYVSSSVGYPLVFVRCGAGYSASVLAIEGGPSSWVITVLCNVSCPAYIFAKLSSVSTSGVGLVVFDADGNPVFDTSKLILNARVVSLLDENVTFQSVSGTNMVAYTGGPVKPSRSVSESWVLVDYYAFTTTEYVCQQELQYVCNTTYQYQCSPDGFGGQSCSYVPVQSCSYQYVTVCRWVTINNTASIYAKVRRTDWSIERATARINANDVISFQWLLHRSGFYNEVIEYMTYSYSYALNALNLPPNYFPPPAFFANTETYSGILTKNNRYPYTTDRANTGSLTCITGVSSDYD